MAQTRDSLINSKRSLIQAYLGNIAGWVQTTWIKRIGNERRHNFLSFPVHVEVMLYYTLSEKSVQFSHSVVFNSATPWTAAHQASLSITNSQSPPKLMSIESMMPSNHLILCRPLLLPPSIFSSFRVFSNESALHVRWPKDWSFSFNTCPSNEHPGLISFRVDWLILLAVQGTLKSLLQHLSSKASGFGAQLSL